jgi:RNA polymerase sigma-70 factor (ECF subfamily)
VLVPAAASEGNTEGAARAGSFDEFYRQRYVPTVRLAAALVGRRDVAEELAQDAFLALHRHWNRVAAYESPEGWIRRVVVNRAVSTLRRRAVELRVSARLANHRRVEPELTSDNSEVWRAVMRLPKRQAQVIALTFVDDLSVGQIAAVLDLADNTVRTHLQRALATLEQKLTPRQVDQ